MHQVLEKLELVRPFFPVAMNQAVYYVNYRAANWSKTLWL